MKLEDFDYHLPKELIAQRPLAKRDESKLMLLEKKTGLIHHHHFFELPDLLDANTVLVFNESKVIPARLVFKVNGGEQEILLIKPVSEKIWECMVRPGAKFQPGTETKVDDHLSFKVREITPHGLRRIEFMTDDLNAYLKTKGLTPLPPYINETLEDSSRYQTIYAKEEGSVAAPTAGFHFTEGVFERLKKKGIQIEFVTLHVGLGTFQPVKTENIEDHQMHSERFELSEEVAQRLNEAKQAEKKIIAVGTTSVRVLESCAKHSYNAGANNTSAVLSTSYSRLEGMSGETDIFIKPGYKWQFIDGLITNFHVPKSTLLMLVSALAERENILKAYEEAKKNQYRFFSFGDSMLIL